jgi:type II restriction/modification system DNA methylase subunit YeeA
LQDELTPNVEDKDVTVRRANLGREIRSLISYAVGCMFGRYSLDVEGLAYAGGEWDTTKYSTFIPDSDNIILFTDEEYLPNDIMKRFVEFIRVVYGDETLEVNLRFISNALGGRGNTARYVIRNYLLRDFYKDHVKIYQKRPIYWLFDSGKNEGFKALIYLHRYNQDTIGKLRVDYLHKIQRVYENELDRMQETIDKSSDAREVSAATKRLEKLKKQLKETKEFDEKIAHLAIARIDLDLDDGVKVNYEKVQTGADGKKYEVLAKI